MTGVDTILTNTQIKSEEFNDLSILVLTTLYGSSLVTLGSFMDIPESEQLIIKASKETGMICEVDKLENEIKVELAKAKKLLKEKFPIKYRWSLVKLFARHPLASIVALIKK